MHTPKYLAAATRIFAAAMLAASPCAAHAQASVAAPVQQPDRGGETAVPQRVVDVQLQPGGVLVGQLVDASGAPSADVEVRVTLADGREAHGKTGEQGGFAFRGVEGLATVATEDTLAVTRVWKPGAAPPNATPALLLVEGQPIARGQHYANPRTQHIFDRGKRLMANPLFVAGVVATAVAIPVAIANDDDDPASP